MGIPLESPWHHRTPEEVVALLETTPELGLSQAEAEARQERFGPNALPGKPRKSALRRFLLQFHQPLVYILLASGAVMAALREPVDAGVILGVVLVNAVVGYLQEAKAVRALTALASTMTTEATLVRGGLTSRQDAAVLVPGDVVLLRSGDKVPADVRIVHSRELRVDESMLTGESLPVEKAPAPVPLAAALAERTSMAYAGALVAYGLGRCVVVATGTGTELGRISALMESADELETPLTRKISRFSHVLLVGILALAAVNFVLGIARGEGAVDMFMASVALAVGAIPEGLPAAVTIILAIGVSRMAQRRAVIRRLPAVETLGGVTVICTDKTGTLTENQMTVRRLWAGGEGAEVTGNGYAPAGAVVVAGKPLGSGPSAAQAECLRAGLLCNDAGLLCNNAELRATREGHGGEGKCGEGNCGVGQGGEAGGEIWRVEGDPSEAALLVSAGKAGLDRATERALRPRLDELAFESERQYMATLHSRPEGPNTGKAEAVVYLKGSAERVLERCSLALDREGEVVPLDEEQALVQLEHMAAQGLRVLAFARKEFLVRPARLEHADVAGDMVFLGLQGMIDPPRAEAVIAVADCRRAGIEVKMITGDHAGTALAIGRMLGLGGAGCAAGGTCRALTGSELAELTEVALAREVREVAVFARVSPEQKLRLVRALQAQGEIVAMTGDGVNDAPALKQADIGVAMGITGTEAAKEAADMVLTDDNFATIAAAVREGRGIYDNLIKFIVWTLPTNLGEGMVILAAFLFGVSLPILPVQILWINMTTAGSLGLMLAFEPREPGLMARPPRPPSRPILGRKLSERIVLVGLLLLVTAFGLFEWELARGASVEQARTVAVNVFVLVETAYLYNSRSFLRSPLALGFFSNPWVNVGAGVMIGLQLLYTYAPFMNTLFASAPIGAVAWAKVVAAALLVFLVVEAEKALRRRVRRG